MINHRTHHNLSIYPDYIIHISLPFWVFDGRRADVFLYICTLSTNSALFDRDKEPNEEIQIMQKFNYLLQR